MTDAKQYAKELHKPVKTVFERRRVNTYFPNDIWSVDLVDMSNIKEDNDNITFLLNIVDIYSRYAYSIPLKSKSATSVLNAFKTLKVFPSNIWADEGKEFFNKDFEKFCKEKKINLYHTYSNLKSVYVERFNRTLKEIMYKYFTEHNTDYYVDVLDEFIEEYNNKIHSSIKQKPIDVYLHDKKPVIKVNKIEYDKTYQSPFNVGDYVRISKFKKTFEKGYTARWSKEVFKIASVDTSQKPYLYELEDLLGEEIEGKFYSEELQKTDLKDFAIIEKIIEKKKVKGKWKYLVKWDGYSDKFNAWIDEKQVEDLK